MNAVPAPPPRSLLVEAPEWLRKHVLAVIGSAVVGGIFGYVTNVWLMAVRYDGWQKVPSGAPATGRGNLLGGGLFWALAMSVVFGVGGYWHAVGTKQFFRDVRELPKVIVSLVRRDGVAARAHLLWGAGISLLAGTILSPAIGAVLAIGLIAAAPGVLGSILSAFIGRIWSSALRAVSPGKEIRPPAVLSLTVGLIGSAGALFIAFVIHSPSIKFLLALICIGVAIALSRRATPGTAVMLILFGAAGAGFVDLLHPLHALANDGGETECGIRIYHLGQWLNSCNGSHTVLSYARPGAVAAAIGAPVGTMIGSIAGRFGGSDDIPPDDGLAGRGYQPSGPLSIADPGPPRQRAYVRGNTLFVVGPDGTMVSAPLNPNGTAGPWTYAGRQPDPAAPPTADPPTPPEALTAAPPPLADDLAHLFDDPPPPPPAPDPGAMPGTPPSGPDLAAIAHALQSIDAGTNWNVVDPSLYNRLAAIQAQVAAGTFGPDQLAALQSLQGALTDAGNQRLATLVAQQQQIADEGMQYIKDQNAAALAAEEAAKAAAAVMSRNEAYISKHMDELPAGQQAAVMNALTRLESSGPPSADLAAQMRQLSGSIFDVQQGALQGQAAAADLAAVKYDELATGASRINTAATLAEGALLFPFVVPGSAAVASQLGAFYLGRNLVVGAVDGYMQGGVKAALVEASKAVLPVNLLTAIYNGDSSGQILLATLRDIGNVAQLGAAGEALGVVGKAPVPAEPATIPAPEGELPRSGPATPQDATWLEGRANGQKNVQDFQDLSNNLKTLKGSGASPEAIQAAEDALQSKVFQMNSDYQSKAILKTLPKEVQGEFAKVLEPTLQKVQQDTIEALNNQGVTRAGRSMIADDLIDLRNASSKGTVGMDRDLALNQTAERELQAQINNAPTGSPEAAAAQQQLSDLREKGWVLTPDGPLQDAQGRVLTGGRFQANGQSLTPFEVRQRAQQAYNEAYKAATGQTAESALQGVTDSTHPEAYADLPVLKNDPAGNPFNPSQAEQTGSVTPYKGLENEHALGVDAFQETARGTVKDINSKLEPLLQVNGASPEVSARVADMKTFLNDVGTGRYMPSEAQALAQQKFGTSIQGLSDQVGSNIAASVKQIGGPIPVPVPAAPLPPRPFGAVGDLVSGQAGAAGATLPGVVSNVQQDRQTAQRNQPGGSQ